MSAESLMYGRYHSCVFSRPGTRPEHGTQSRMGGDARGQGKTKPLTQRRAMLSGALAAWPCALRWHVTPIGIGCGDVVPAGRRGKKKGDDEEDDDDEEVDEDEDDDGLPRGFGTGMAGAATMGLTRMTRPSGERQTPPPSTGTGASTAEPLLVDPDPAPAPEPSSASECPPSSASSATASSGDRSGPVDE
jgi:hypothetical protein